jgi:hypothetical protein
MFAILRSLPEGRSGTARARTHLDHDGYLHPTTPNHQREAVEKMAQLVTNGDELAIWAEMADPQTTQIHWFRWWHSGIRTYDFHRVNVAVKMLGAGMMISVRTATKRELVIDWLRCGRIITCARSAMSRNRNRNFIFGSSIQLESQVAESTTSKRGIVR